MNVTRRATAVALRHAAAGGAVKAGVDLVEIGHGVEAIREIADRRDRSEIPVHRVQGLEGDELRPPGRLGRKKRPEVVEVVVAKDPALRAREPDALDH